MVNSKLRKQKVESKLPPASRLPTPALLAMTYLTIPVREADVSVKPGAQAPGSEVSDPRSPRRLTAIGMVPRMRKVCRPSRARDSKLSTFPGVSLRSTKGFTLSPAPEAEESSSISLPPYFP
jgi:hypothetical protein